MCSTKMFRQKHGKAVISIGKISVGVVESTSEQSDEIQAR
jgi:hypothetical protein